MITQNQIADAFGRATTDFSSSAALQKLLSGKSTPDEVREFISNVCRTHLLSSHIVAFLYASLPTKASELVKENLLEEMGHSEGGKAHSALLLELAKGSGFNDKDIERLIHESQQQIRLFFAQKITFPTLKDLCLSIMLETESFEFLLSRCSSQIAKALREHYKIPQPALHWFELHSEVDIRHAEEGLTIIREYVSFHQIDDARFEQILKATFAKNVFLKRYFPSDAAVPS